MTARAAPAAPALIVGSHIDSVRDAGRYDGPLGVMLGIEAVATLASEGRRLPFAIEVYAFGDEEGSRFPAPMLTSAAVAGTFDPASLVEDYELGLTIADAGGRGCFARVRDAAGDVVAVRAYFPDTVHAAVRQKARWMAGIALAGWDRTGWGPPGPHP